MPTRSSYIIDYVNMLKCWLWPLFSCKKGYANSAPIAQPQHNNRQWFTAVNNGSSATESKSASGKASDGISVSATAVSNSNSNGADAGGLIFNSNTNQDNNNNSFQFSFSSAWNAVSNFTNTDALSNVINNVSTAMRDAVFNSFHFSDVFNNNGVAVRHIIFKNGLVFQIIHCVFACEI